jgi:hypothetical protein
MYAYFNVALSHNKFNDMFQDIFRRRHKRHDYH